jgi:1,4-dihydroxy-6-naphthoate synthase
MTAVSETAKTPGSNASGQVREITVAHSPDSDDAFMFYGLATNKVRTPGLRFSHTLCDIETLNQKAREGVYDVSAISFHAYPYVQDKYALMACGGSVGEGYGPMIVSPRPFTWRCICLLREWKPRLCRSIRSSRKCSRGNSKPD